MLVFGTVINIDEKLRRAKLRLPEYEDFETDWFFIPQLCTKKDKSSSCLSLDTLCAAVCNDDMTDGCIIGAIYSDEDVSIIGDENIKYIAFSDGALFQYDKEKHLLSVIVPGNYTLKVNKLIVDGDLVCTKDISDKNGTLDSVRQHSNNHAHSNGNNGADTGTPTTTI